MAHSSSHYGSIDDENLDNGRTSAIPDGRASASSVQEEIDELKESLKFESLQNSNRFNDEWDSFSSRMSDFNAYLVKNVQRMIDNDWSLLISLVFLIGTANLGISYYTAFFPQYAKKLHDATSLEIGIVMAAVYSSIAICSPFVFKFIEVSKIRPEKCLWSGFVISMASVTYFAFIEQVPGSTNNNIFITECIIVRIIQGIGVALVNVSAGIVSLRYLSRPSSAESRQLVQSVVALGYMTGPPLGGIMFFFVNWKLAFLILALFHVIVLLCAVCLFYMSGRVASDTNDLEETEIGDFTDLLYNPLVLFLLFNNVVGVMEFAFMHPTLGIHLAQEAGYSPLGVGIVYLVRDGAYCVAVLMFALLQKLSGPFLVLSFGHILCGGGYLLLGPAPFLGLKFSLLLIYIGIVIIGFGVACPMVSTLDSLLLVVPLRREEDSEKALKAVLNILYVILTSSFYTGSLLGVAFGGLLDYALDSYPLTYTTMAFMLFGQSILVIAFAAYLKFAYGLDFIRNSKKIV